MPRQPPRQCTSSGSTANCPSRGRKMPPLTGAVPGAASTRVRQLTYTAGGAVLVVRLLSARLTFLQSPDCRWPPTVTKSATVTPIGEHHAGPTPFPGPALSLPPAGASFPFSDDPLPVCGGHPALAKAAAWCCTGNLRRRTFQHVLTGVPLAKEELIEMQGRVDEVLPDSRFRVTLENGHQLIAYTGGKCASTASACWPATRSRSRCRPMT